jgi:Selenocysteine synthase N terminal
MEARTKQTLSAEQADLLRQIPGVDELLAQPRLAALAERVDRNVLVEVTRGAALAHYGPDTVCFARRDGGFGC